MPDQIRTVEPLPGSQTCVLVPGYGEMAVPADWALLPPGDAALTRRVKQEGPHWVMQSRRGRRTFTHGVWAPAERIARLRAALEGERDTPAYQKRRAAETQRRDLKQQAYVETFHRAVLRYLAFAPRHAELAEKLAQAVTEHATPVGSGTVARTQRIPVAQRAESAVIAWMRHQTTAYDHMRIARIKGERRAVRRKLAEHSNALLERYRRDEVADVSACPLYKAVML